MPRLLAYYVDENAQYNLSSDDTGHFVDFSTEIIPRAGIDSVHKTIYVKNIHHYPMGLEPHTTDKDLTITEYPEFLEPNQIGKVVLTFTPSEDRVNPIEHGSWDFTKVVYSNIK